MTGDFTLKLERFLGLRTSVDGSHELKDSESPDMLNFKITSGGKLKRRDGCEKIFSLPGLRGIYYGKLNGKEIYLAVGGEVLYASHEGFDTLSPVEGEIPGKETVQFFLFYNALYLLTGDGIRKFDGERLSVPEPYVPTLMIGTSPQGDGVLYEEANILTPYFKQKFSPDGTSKYFHPVLKRLEGVIWVKVNGRLVESDSYYWNEANRSLTMLSVPSEGVDTMEVMFEVYREGGEENRILNCRNAVSFGGANDTRAFLYGNRETPGMRYHSGVVDGKPCFEYFPETAYALVGSGEDITSVLRHYDRLLIWTENAAYYSYLEYMNGVDGKLVASFPVLPLSDDRGCSARGQAVLVENDPCTVGASGLLRWVSTNIRDERNAILFSDPIARALQNEDATKAILFNRKASSELYVSFDHRIYVYHYGRKLFYYYEAPVAIRRFLEVGNQLFFASDEGIYHAVGDLDDGRKIPVRWRSKKMAFGDGNREKNLFRVALSVKAPSPLSFLVTLKTDDDKEEEKLFSMEGTGQEIRKSLRYLKRRFHYLELCISSSDAMPAHVLGLEIKGRQIDRNV
ncbi:MAG: hypothetical protein IKT50_01620 [Clostridia bacterium]|nr:hypothetical protein [Clostridia bacterium]